MKLSRRSFLAGVSCLALICGSCDARPIHGVVTPAPPSGFNGGKSQVNFNFLQIGGDFPFLNCLKTAQVLGFIDNSGYPDPNTLDTDGYPTSISHGGLATVFFVPTQAERPGNYVATWNGNGTIFCGMNNTLISGSKISVSGSGRYVFSTTDDRFYMGIESIGSPHITNLQVFHVDDEAALAAGNVFGVKFKARLVEANFGVLRFLNWIPGNTTNMTTWATRPPITGVCWGQCEFRASLFAGTTTNVGAAYSATLGGFALVDKATVHVRFNASNSSACTLNVSGTGAKNILDAYSGALSIGGNSYPVAGVLATLVYDATLDAWIKQGGDVAEGNAGLNNGCPPELMVRLCSEIGAHPHFVCPPLAIDPATDYIPSLAAYCRDNAPAWMIPRFEGPNELWNNSGGFYQTGYANAKATAYGWGADYNNWYGKIMSVLGQAVSTVYSNDRSKYQVLCGVQTGTGNNAFGTAASDDRLASTLYLAQVAPPQAPYTKSAASNWVTHICCAQYYTPSDYGTGTETTLAAAYAGGDQTAPITYAATSNSGGGSFTLSACAILYANWKTWAQGFGIQKMCGYEGGYSPDYTLFGTSQVDLLRAASKQSPALNGFTTTNYNNFIGLTSGGFTAEFPSCFQFTGLTPSNNAWSVLEDIYQSPNPPQWTAIVAFNVP